MVDFSFKTYLNHGSRPSLLQEMLCSKSRDLISIHSNFSLQVLAHVKSSPHTLHWVAGFQVWSKFKSCGSEHASNCQKGPNLSVLGPL